MPETCLWVVAAFLQLSGVHAVQDTATTSSQPPLTTSSTPPGTRHQLDRTPIILLYFVALALMVSMWAYSVFAKRKFEKQGSNLKLLQTEDRIFAGLLKNFSLQSVNEHVFRGFRRKVDTVSVGFQDLSTTIKGGRGISTGFKNVPDKVVLASVSGQFEAGRMSAIMGPSGAGKTTFLNVLCGKTKAGGEWEVTGSVLVNGVSMDISELQPIMGFVPQDDVVHEGLTVRENILFSAALRNAAGTRAHTLKKVTDDVLQVLQLEAQQHIVVGNRVSGGGLSGGQRKRVNIGLELAACPTLLFLDEPTSGLDSTSSLMLCGMLKKMTELGMTVVMVIHQPRYSLFTLIDDVLLLGKGGRTVYVGPTNGAKAYLENLGFAMPPNENPSDWMMDVLSGQVESADAKMPSSRLPEALFEAWEQGPGYSPPGDREMLREASLTDDRHDQEVIKGHVKDAWAKHCTDAGSMDAAGFQELLEGCIGHEIEDPNVVSGMLARIAGSEDAECITQQQFVRFLLQFRHMGIEGASLADGCDDEPSDTASESEESSDCSADDPRLITATQNRKQVQVGDLHRELPGFFGHLTVVMKRQALQWWRTMTIRILFIAVVIFSGVFLGIFDAFIFGEPQWMPPNFLNTHISIDLLISVYCLSCFNRDQPVYWREASHGLNRFAFLCGRMIVDTLDWVLLCFFFTSTYYIIVNPQLHFEVYMIPFFLVAFTASGWGYLISSLLPPILAPFVAAVLAFMMGGILGLPQKMDRFLDGSYMEAMVSLVCFTRWSVPMDFLAYVNDVGVDLSKYDIMIKEQYRIYTEGYAQSHWNLPVERSPWWTGFLALTTMGFVLRLATYPALRFINAGKQV